MMAFFTWLQNTPFSMWIVSSDSIWAYPSILTAHTVGLGLLVGAAFVIDLRILGVAPEVPMASLQRLYTYAWLGFYINLVSGLLLFASEAADKATQPIFMVKLAFVFAGVIVSRMIQNRAFKTTGLDLSRLRMLASLSLFIWAGAITSGRLMAYLSNK